MAIWINQSQNFIGKQGNRKPSVYSCERSLLFARASYVQCAQAGTGWMSTEVFAWQSSQNN